MKKKILVVDDEPDLVDILSFELSDQYDVTTAFSGDEALDLLVKNNFDVVLSDVNMPKMDGLEMLKQLYQKEIKVPVIFITAFSDFDKLTKAWQIGAFDFLDKPVDFEKMKSIMFKAINTDRNELGVRKSELTEAKMIEYSKEAKKRGMSIRDYIFSL